MSASHPSHSPAMHDLGRRDLVGAWAATGVIVAGLVGMGVAMTRADLDLSYGASAWLRGLAVAVVVVLAAIAVRLGRRAQQEGHPSGLLAGLLASVVAGSTVLLMALSTVAHLVGFE